MNKWTVTAEVTYEIEAVDKAMAINKTIEKIEAEQTAGVYTVDLFTFTVKPSQYNEQ